MKKQIQKQPTRGGLTPVRVDDLPHKTGLTVNLVCKEIIIKPKSHVGALGDSIEVKYEKQLLDEDGQIVSINKLVYVVKDTGDLCSYDLYEDTVFDQADIDNPLYDVTYVGRQVDENGDLLLDENGVPVAEGTVTSISYVDGQIEEEDPENPGQMIMVDNVVSVEPLHRKGQIDPSTEVVVTTGHEPLADWTYAVGDMITNAVIEQMKTRNGYV